MATCDHRLVSVSLSRWTQFEADCRIGGLFDLDRTSQSLIWLHQLGITAARSAVSFNGFSDAERGVILAVHRRVSQIAVAMLCCRGVPAGVQVTPHSGPPLLEAPPSPSGEGSLVIHPATVI